MKMAQDGEIASAISAAYELSAKLVEHWSHSVHCHYLKTLPHRFPAPHCIQFRCLYRPLYNCLSLIDFIIFCR